MEHRDETNLKTFNTAKVFAEQILFPLMFTYQKYMRISDFGYENIVEASNYSEEHREILKFNGLKASADVSLNLINAIKSTVMLKKNQEEITQMEEIIVTLEKVKTIFSEDKDKFFMNIYKNNRRMEKLDRDYFEQVKKIIVTCYTNTEMLMTRNKLLFSDSKDEFASDDEIKEDILKRYVEG